MSHQHAVSDSSLAFRALSSFVIALATLSGISGPASAQGANSPAVTSPTGNPYRACTDGTSNEDRATCMKEAGAAKAEAQRGQLTNHGSNYDSNAMQRCDALPGDQKEACRLRISGAGTTSGSVAGGGLVREVVTQDPSPGQSAPKPTPVPTPDPMPMPIPMPSPTTGAGTTTDGAGASPR